MVDGAKVGYVFSYRDIGERKQVEIKLLKLQVTIVLLLVVVGQKLSLALQQSVVTLRELLVLQLLYSLQLEATF